MSGFGGTFKTDNNPVREPTRSHLLYQLQQTLFDNEEMQFKLKDIINTILELDKDKE